MSDCSVAFLLLQSRQDKGPSEDDDDEDKDDGDEEDKDDGNDNASED